MSRFKKRESLEKQLKRLEEEMNLTIQGAPEVYQVEEKEEKEDTVSVSPPGLVTAENIDSPEKTEYPVPATTESFLQIIRKPSFYLTSAVIIIIILFLFLAPLFQFSTPLRSDSDLPGVQVAFRYYYNIFGQKQREETIVFLDHKKVVILLPMQQWVNLEKSKKLLAIEHYQQQD